MSSSRSALSSLASSMRFWEARTPTFPAMGLPTPEASVGKVGVLGLFGLFALG
jgi:hypothetical protein